MRYAPFFLDPSTPPEGKPRRQMTAPDDPPTHLEQRGQDLGITFRRGRTWTSNSHLGHEAAEFIADNYADSAEAFHRRMFKAYFDEIEDIGSIDQVVRFAEEAGVPANEVREVLQSGSMRKQVDDAIAWARDAGVRAVPTFVIDEKYAVVGAQTVEVFEDVMERLGKVRRM